MAINIYNVRNHKLNASKKQITDIFCTDNFGGTICETDNGGATLSDAIVVDGTIANWGEQYESVPFICGGCLVDIDTTEVLPSLSGEKWLAVVELSYNNLTNDNIENDSTTSVKLTKYLCSDLHLEAQTSQEEYNADVFKFTINNKEYRYYGNTCVKDTNTFFVPLYGILNGGSTYTKLLMNVDKVSSLEAYLNAAAYAKLKRYSEATFVWHDGGDVVVPNDGDIKEKKGKIGNLLIKENTISPLSNNNIKLNFNKVNLPLIDYISTSESSLNNVRPLVFDNATNKNINYVETIPVSAGGTNATTKKQAKINLGITYGTVEPTATSGITGSEGDIYFWIVE